jgi:hypothetical protein
LSYRRHEAPGAFDLILQAEGAREACLELSADLINWQTYTTVPNPAAPRVLTVPDTAPKAFFRAVAQP